MFNLTFTTTTFYRILGRIGIIYAKGKKIGSRAYHEESPEEVNSIIL